MTRIIAGHLSGRRLHTPQGKSTRPTSDRTREALFASLEATHDLTEGPFIDLYAGSGAVGLEAVSRGAPHAYLVDNARPAITTIKRNIADLALASRVTLLPVSAAAAVPQLAGTRASTVFADPPYAVSADDLADVLTGLLAADAIESDAVVVIERAAREEWTWPAGLEADRDRRYGEARLWYGRPL